VPLSTLWLKLLLVPLLISGASLAGRRWGPQVGGWIVGLPLTSGPVVLFLALEQGPAFAAGSAAGAMLGLVSVTGFCVTYALLAWRAPWFLCMLAGWGVFLLSTALLTEIVVSLAASFAGVVTVMALALRLLPHASSQRPAAHPPAWDIPLRIAAATALVLGLTAVAGRLGPRLSGLLTPFPVYVTVLTVFTHHLGGGAAATQLLRGVIIGSFSFALFFAVVARFLEGQGLLITFGGAVAATLLSHAVLLWTLGASTNRAAGAG
jgi:hypothetical protein